MLRFADMHFGESKSWLLQDNAFSPDKLATGRSCGTARANDRDPRSSKSD
jgi:hypothetical protein